MTLPCFAIASLTAGIGECGNDGVVRALDLRRRHALRTDHREPRFDHIARHALLDERQDVRAPPARAGPCPRRWRAACRLCKCCWTLGSAAVANSTCPPRRSVSIGPTPLYGTCVALAPASSRKSSDARCRIVPLPLEP
mgnify:CR=1 FL=1